MLKIIIALLLLTPAAHAQQRGMLQIDAGAGIAEKTCTIRIFNGPQLQSVTTEGCDVKQPMRDLVITRDGDTTTLTFKQNSSTGTALPPGQNMCMRGDGSIGPCPVK